MRCFASFCGVPPAACVLRLLAPSAAVVVFIDNHCVWDGVEVMH